MKIERAGNRTIEKIDCRNAKLTSVVQLNSVQGYFPLLSFRQSQKLVDIVDGRGVTNECHQAESMVTGMNLRWQLMYCLSKNVVCKLQ